MTPSRHHRRDSAVPPDHATRGKTRPNRLRRIDHLIAHWDPALLRRRDGAFEGAAWVDLGYGASPVTTLELAARLRRAGHVGSVVGIENDPERVAAAQGSATDDVRFVRGGFELAPDAVGPVRGVRAFNVLRQYAESDVGPAYRAMSAAILPGGLLVEGTSDPSGRAWTALVSRVSAAGGTVEAFVAGTNWRGPIDANTFQAVLPKRWIHRMVPGEPVHEFMTTWSTALRDEAGAVTWGPRFALSRIAARLRRSGFDVDARRRFVRRGWIVWRRPPVNPWAFTDESPR